MLPDRSPDVTIARLDPCAPAVAMHLKDVSDCQSVPSHPVCPDRPIAVYPTVPILDPCTVTEEDPVPGPFIFCDKLRFGASIERD